MQRGNMSNQILEGHSILAAALQKYYSALKSLSEFGASGNFFDDVSSLDRFFSEFRNITFVIQKGLKTEEDKQKYKILRDKYLVGETLKWFVDSRNLTTKEKPFPLKKELIIKIFHKNRTIVLRNECLIVNLDESFEGSLQIIRKEFMEKYGLVEINISTTIVFKEEDVEIDLYPKLMLGITQMNAFINELKEVFPCNCEKCNSLSEFLNQALLSVHEKEIGFVNDYTINHETIFGERMEVCFTDKNKNIIFLSKQRLSITNTFFDEGNGDSLQIFKKFIIMHVLIYQGQHHNIMPVFMILYADKTFKILPFSSNIKATFYRKMNEITEDENFDDIIAVFYCGEYYGFDEDQIPEISDKIYSERICVAKIEMLAFTMIPREGIQQTISFDTKLIDDMQYVKDMINDCSSYVETDLDWIKPIKEKLQK